MRPYPDIQYIGIVKPPSLSSQLRKRWRSVSHKYIIVQLYLTSNSVSESSQGVNVWSITLHSDCYSTSFLHSVRLLEVYPFLTRVSTPFPPLYRQLLNRLSGHRLSHLHRLTYRRSNIFGSKTLYPVQVRKIKVTWKATYIYKTVQTHRTFERRLQLHHLGWIKYWRILSLSSIVHNMEIIHDPYYSHNTQ